MFYSLHMLVIPGAIIGLIMLHLYLVVRLGVSSPPWSRRGSGRDRVEAPPPIGGREGLDPARRRGEANG